MTREEASRQQHPTSYAILPVRPADVTTRGRVVQNEVSGQSAFTNRSAIRPEVRVTLDLSPDSEVPTDRVRGIDSPPTTKQVGVVISLILPPRQGAKRAHSDLTLV